MGSKGDGVFRGTIDDLKARIEAAGLVGFWNESNGHWQFRSQSKGVLSWWPSTGTYTCQGQPAGRVALEAALSGGAAAAVRPARPGGGEPARPTQIFIVHGHDTQGRDQLELALRRLGLEPFVLMNESGQGQTIIEALEGKIGRDYSSDFGIVLMTPDDAGFAKSEGEAGLQPRARQNVVLEAGMLLASLTRARVAIVVKGHLELPSDLEGIIRYHYNDHVREIVPKLCQRLKEAGFEIRPDQIAAAAQ